MFGRHNIQNIILATVSRSVHTDPLRIYSLNDDTMTTTSPTESTTMTAQADTRITTSSSFLQIIMNFVQNAVSVHCYIILPFMLIFFRL